MAAGLATVALALGGCGDSVHAGGENAAIHPSSGIWVSPTVGAENISVMLAPQPPSAVPGHPADGGAARPGHRGDPDPVRRHGRLLAGRPYGNVYGAYDQHFWWQGECGDTTAQVTVELYPTAAAASANAHHPSPSSLLDRYQDGNVLVDVYSNAPQTVLAELGTVKGLAPVPGYGG